MDQVDGKSAALKITLPDNLLNEVEAYTNRFGQSKSEFIKEAIRAKLGSDQAWLAKRYFFKRRNPVMDTKKLIEALASAPQGSLLKLAMGCADLPNTASIELAYLVKYYGRTIYFQFGPYRPSVLQSAIYLDLSQIAYESGALVIPETQLVGTPYSILPTTYFIYSVDIDYVWDADLSPPEIQNTSAFSYVSKPF